MVDLKKLLESLSMGQAFNPFVTHFITPLSNRKKPKKRFIAFDSEDDSKGNVSIINFYDGADHYTFHHKQRNNFLAEATEFLINRATSGTIFVAHNLEYDITNLLRWCDWAPIKEMIYSSRLISATLIDCPGVEMWDSFNLYPAPLSALAKVVGMEKGDFLSAREDLAENIKYCQSDCEILWAFMDKYQNSLLENLNVEIRPTIGATAMKAYRTAFLKESIPACSIPLMLEAYYGGRTEAFVIDDINEPIVVADVNSMYPTEMKKEYPDINKIEPSKLDTHKFGVGRFRIRVPKMHIPPLPYRYEKRLFFPVGDLEGIWTYAEVRYALSLGCELLEEFDGAVGTNKGCYPMSDYVDHFYTKRQIAKENGDAFEDVTNKLVLNNLYGKWGQHTDRTILTQVPVKDDAEMEFVRTLGPFEVWKKVMKEPPHTTNFMWASYVTSYSRISMHRILNAVHEAGHRVLYCDTDSVMYVKKNNSRPYVVSNKLGDLDEEHYVSGKFITAKGYYLNSTDGKTKLACKGVPKKFGMDFLMTGEAVIQKPVKMREGLLQNLTANYWRDVEKKMRTQYLKRCGSPDTRAWDVSELPYVLELIKKENEKNSKNDEFLFDFMETEN